MSAIRGIGLFVYFVVANQEVPATAQIGPAPPLPSANATMSLQWVDASGRVSLDVSSAPWLIDTKANSEKPFQAFELLPFPKLPVGEVRRITLDRYCIMQERLVLLSTSTSQSEVNATVAEKLLGGDGDSKPNRVSEVDGVISTYGENASASAQMVYRFFVLADPKGMVQFRIVCHAFAEPAEAQAEAVADIRKVLDLVRIDLAD